ncbi:MAG: MarR family winged helix-turn-helix transcriptional regulator [Emcibacteraceae bacterium]|nr:MarR family winged helix-turn-helix transcriptional regulator [Emcibacteraceae bacterium]MDG1996726.1 MarR family winged helix-turn-helix transcriptional regulator [Emcibacteraceae bacterium]
MKFELSGHAGLKLWKQALTNIVLKKGPDLTTRQYCVLLAVYLEPKQHTVRGLAAAIDVSKPVITRCIDSLSILGFVKRVRDEEDRRNVFITRTVKGAVFLTDFAAMIEQSNNEVKED